MQFQDANILAFHPVLDHRNVFPHPILVPRELGAQFLALRITIVAPKVPNLIEATELARPIPKIDAVVVAATGRPTSSACFRYFGKSVGRK